MKEDLYKDSFEALFKATVDGILVIDQTGIVELMNPAAERLFGYREDELVEHHCIELIPEEYQTLLDHDVENFLGTGREIMMQNKDGDCFPVHLSVVRADDTEKPLFIGVFRDLTDQKLKEKELQEREKDIRLLRDRLLNVERMSALGEVSSSLAHDINQPLTVIAAYAQACKKLVQSGNANSDDLVNALKKIDIQAHRASQVINSIRYFAKRSSSEVSEQSFQKLLLEVSAIAESYVQDNGMRIELDLEDIPYSELVVVEPYQIQQVILCLINNAVESMIILDENGSPRELDNTGNTITIRARMLGSVLEIAVIDQGCGIDEDQVQHIFNTFYTTKTGGLGVGLSICQSIVTARGGQIDFTPNQGRGSTFSFTLPGITGSLK